MCNFDFDELIGNAIYECLLASVDYIDIFDLLNYAMDIIDCINMSVEISERYKGSISHTDLYQSALQGKIFDWKDDKLVIKKQVDIREIYEKYRRYLPPVKSRAYLDNTIRAKFFSIITMGKGDMYA